MVTAHDEARSGAHPNAGGPPLAGGAGVAAGRYKKLLYMCAVPPSGLAGTSIIAKQILAGYEQERLHVLCCRRLHRGGEEGGTPQYLPCKHTTVPDYGVRVRPQRYTSLLAEDLNCFRVPQILRAAKRIIAAEGIEAIFTIPWSADFSLAAYFLHRQTGIPLYVFEMDDWEAGPALILNGPLKRRYHGPMLRAAAQTWFISPPMVDAFRARFGVEGRFLCQVVDVDTYQKAARGAPPPGAGEEIKLVYTGSVNNAFRGSLRFLCRLLNEGMTIDGRRVRMDMYTQAAQGELAGPGVAMRGYVPMDQIPGILAGADALVMGVSFEPDVEQMVRTSIFTKTIDYLASGRPTLMIAPEYAAVARYCRDGAEVKDTATVVGRLERAAVEEAIGGILRDREGTARRSERGVELVRRNHSPASIEPNFLRYFRADGGVKA